MEAFEKLSAVPDVLKAIEISVRNSAAISSNIASFQQVWKDRVELAKKKIPDLVVGSGGEILYLNGISPGCRACKSGTWDCIFVSMHCNLDCSFCLVPGASKKFRGSIFGAGPEEIAAKYEKTEIAGISFSGGEPFLEISTLLDWSAWFKKRYPDKYYWVYTNGLLVREEDIKRLADIGIDEIRFNMAATGYDHPVVMENLALSARYIPSVTVEIPAIPEHAAKLASCLAKWCEAGVRFLNLHELMYEAGTNSESATGRRQTIINVDGHSCQINPDSRDLTIDVMGKVYEEKLPLQVNDCSFQSKMLQLRGRRKCVSPIVKSDHEQLVNGEFLESCLAYKGTDVYFFHPAFLQEMRQKYKDHNYYKLVRTAPLNLADPGRWVALERLNRHD